MDFTFIQDEQIRDDVKKLFTGEVSISTSDGD